MLDLSRLEKPVFIIDRNKVKNNIDSMARKAAKSRVRLRPHVKTHQSAAVASWFRNFGVESLTVSSVAMASYFVSNGWKDIMIAVPVNINQIQAIDDLAGTCSLHVIVDSDVSTQKLVEEIKHPLRVWLEVDTGYHRTGVAIEDSALLKNIAKKVRQNRFLDLRGLLVHDGHTYSAPGAEGVRAIFKSSFRSITGALDILKAAGFPDLELSIGDTPTCSVLDAFPAPITEIRPGTFTFYDLVQAGIGGVCTTGDIAAAVACPVISKHSERGEVILYGGSVHISKEYIKNKEGSASYGLICRLNQKQTGWGKPLSGVSLISLSQEHGIIRGPASFVKSVEIGDTLVALPVHACLTANLHREFHVLGEGTIPKFQL